MADEKEQPQGDGAEPAADATNEGRSSQEPAEGADDKPGGGSGSPAK